MGVKRDFLYINIEIRLQYIHQMQPLTLIALRHFYRKTYRNSLIC